MITTDYTHMYEFHCRDLGFNDDFVTRGDTMQEVMDSAISHGKECHAIKESDLTPELKEKIKSKIKETR